MLLIFHEDNWCLWKRDSRPEKGENVHHVECFFITISIFVPEIYDLKKYSFVEKVWIVQKRVTLMLFHVGASRKVCVVFLVSCRHWFSLLETRKTDRSLSRVKRQTWHKGHWDLRVFLSTAPTWLFRWSHPEKRTEFQSGFPLSQIEGCLVLCLCWLSYEVHWCFGRDCLQFTVVLTPLEIGRDPLCIPRPYNFFLLVRPVRTNRCFCWLQSTQYWWMMANWFPSKRKDNVF